MIADSGATYVITGASGWLGKALLELLSAHLGDTVHQRVIAASDTQSTITLRNGNSLKCYPFSELPLLPPNKSYILFHFAFLTKEKVDKLSSDAFLQLNLHIRQVVSDFILNTKPIAMVYASSGAVYNQEPTNPYGILKLEDEKHFTAIAKSLPMKLVIPRVFNLAGPYINKFTDYALSSFIMQAVQNKKISIQARHPVVRSYIHARDLLTLCFSCIFDQTQKQIVTFDTVGERELELGELADLVLQSLQMNNIPIERNYDPSLPANYYVGNGDAQHALLTRYNHVLASTRAGVDDTCAYLAALNELKTVT